MAKTCNRECHKNSTSTVVITQLLYVEYNYVYYFGFILKITHTSYSRLNINLLNVCGYTMLKGIM